MSMLLWALATAGHAPPLELLRGASVLAIADMQDLKVFLGGVGFRVQDFLSGVGEVEVRQ